MNKSLTMIGTVLVWSITVVVLRPCDAAEPAPSMVAFDEQIRPLLAQHCFDCHADDEPQGNLRIDTLGVDVADDQFDATTWQDVLDQITAGKMPPAEAAQPSSVQRQQLVDWITASLDEAAQSKRYADGRVLMRRLTRYEYANTMRDLLGIELDFARDLPPEPASPEGFLNDGGTLEMSATQIEAYLTAARRGLQLAIVEGDKPEIFRYHQTQTAVGKLPRSREGGQLPVNPEFVLDIPKFPRTGEFRLLVRAGATVPQGAGVPRMQVSLGNVPGIIHVPRKLLGEVDVTAPAYAPQTFEFRGRLEDFPQPGDREFGANVDFNGMIALIDFVDADGGELRYRDRTYSDPPPKANPKAGDQGKPPANGREAPRGGPRYDVIIDSVEFETPYLPAWPPMSHQRLLAHSSATAKVDQQAEEIIGRFMRLAFRRPVNDEEVDQMMGLFQTIRPRTPSFESALRETLAAILVSPHFLYIVEDRSDGRQRLTPHELATRLAYFLWSTMPDQTLITAVTSVAQQRPADRAAAENALAGEVQRMLDDPRSAELVNHFSDQWFGLDALDRVAVNPEFYPDFDDQLKQAMREQTRQFLREILVHNRSCLELLDSDWTITNRELARHYELTELPSSSQFQRVTLAAEDRRGGILTHGCFLLSQSDGERPHPIRRAVWILDRLLDSPPPSPPPDVPDLVPATGAAAALTLKQQLEAHRGKEACRSCHEGIDPWGIPLEHFDATGSWRETSPVRVATPQGKKPGNNVPIVDASAVLPDGTKLSGVADLNNYLINQRRETFARSVVKRMASYALGRQLDIGDRKEIARLTDQFAENDYRLRDLVVELVQSDLFQMK